MALADPRTGPIVSLHRATLHLPPLPGAGEAEEEWSMILCSFCYDGKHDECPGSPHGSALQDENCYHWYAVCDCSCAAASARRREILGYASEVGPPMP